MHQKIKKNKSILTKKEVIDFQEKIYNFFLKNKRHFPWRETKEPYHILVSEIMLQQTQTFRVLPKYLSFLEQFPTIKNLAASDLPSVLSFWQGLGYNRRAKYLLESAKIIAEKNDGNIPNDQEYLETLPGIGPYTAAAICTFSYNKPLLFLETNIRAVFLHEFFPKEEVKIKDVKILPYLEITLDQNNPKEWYYALMDYGSFLKNNYKNPTQRSSTYTKQSKFEGSKRQIRGRIIKLLTQEGPQHIENILENIADIRIKAVISDLIAEELIEINHDNISIKSYK